MTAAIHDNQTEADAKSHTSYRSTHSSRSSVLSRAREYTRKMEGEAAQRAKSLERQSNAASATDTAEGGTPRSQSAGRGMTGNRMSTRERAMASVEKENNYARPKPTTPQTPASVRTSGDLTVSTVQRTSTAPKESVAKSPARSSLARRQPVEGEQAQEAVVSPELLVDALSGHEDGLLAIAERLMEHYDSGYDVMGEAIIDAFADVQKLFQHVVEAAHMEGAAFEASRKEEEIKELKKQAAQSPHYGENHADDQSSLPPSPVGPVRHDEFIDQDVKDCLTEAIRQGAPLKETSKHMECYLIYEHACQNASSLLPVDSDHRGRLQLSIARAESMSPDRGCAILRYAMDDVLRSGLRAGKTLVPDISKRADVVLSKPKGHPSMNGSTGQAGVVQSSEEALASLVEEMKEIMDAPVYKDTPLQHVAKRFWNALADAQKSHVRNEERLEQNLGKLKGEFLLARAEWEEKLTRAEGQAEQFKRKYLVVKDSGGSSVMEDSRTISQRLAARSAEDDGASGYSSTRGRDSVRRGESVASLGSGLAQHARSLVGSFACTGNNERTGSVLATELAEGRQDGQNEWRESRRRSNSAPRNNENGKSNLTSSSEQQRYDSDYTNGGSGKPRSFREFSPRRVDV